MSPDRSQLPSPARNRALVSHLLVLSWVALGVSGCGDEGDPARDSGVDAPARDAARDAIPDAGDHEAPNPASIGAVACILDPDCTEVMVAAHRGHFVFVPENSLAAIREAARIGADVVELDIRPTSDGVLLAMHDSTVDRTTDGTGEVDALSWADVSALSLNGGDPANDETYRIPRFDEVLAVAREEGLGLFLFQTNRADILIPAAWRYRRTGEFPDRCPAPVE